MISDSHNAINYIYSREVCLNNRSRL